MSSWITDRLRRSAGERGFTLIEVMVALVIIGLLSAAMVPLLLTGAKASQLTKMSTVAKNLSAARLGEMRALPYHVAYSNGPFLDLLDEYYTNLQTSATAIPNGGQGAYVASGAGTNGEPTGSFYRVSFSGTQPAGYLQIPAPYTQVVDTQFLVPNKSPQQAITPPPAYSNQPTGSQTDQPPSLIVGVTVLTSWTVGGQSHTYRVYTEISNDGHGDPLVTTQAGATALSIQTAAYDDSALAVTLGQVGLNGTLSTEANASAQAEAASLTRTDPTGATTYTPTLGATTQAVAPPSPAGSAGTSTVGAKSVGGAETPCNGWGAVGPTSVSDVSATVASAQPRMPSDVETTPNAVTASLNANSGNSCSGLWFSNVLAGSTSNPALNLPANTPVVSIPDTTGNGVVVQGSAGADTPALTFTNPRPPVTSRASVTFNQEIDLFPGVVADGSHHGALVYITGLSASISCKSGQLAQGQYAGTLNYWVATSPTAGAYQAISLSSGNANLASQLSGALGQAVRYNAAGVAVPLSTYIASWTAGQLVQQQSGGSGHVALNTIPAVLSVLTAPTLASSYTNAEDSALSMSIGQVSCVSQDNR